MAMRDKQKNVERDAILRYVIQMLEEITADWDVGEIAEGTRLGHLGLESINLVYLIAEIQQYYDLQDLLFRKLMALGIQINDLRVADLVEAVESLKLFASGQEETQRWPGSVPIA
jgi:hypothetical protein